MLRVGTAPWLLRHELRLAWRGLGMRGLWGLQALVLLGGTVLLALHAVAYLVMNHFRDVALPPLAIIGIGALVWFGVMLMLSQAMMQSVNVLFVRGDLDLLLASPLPPRSVFAVRGLGVAMACAAPYLLLLAPVADVGLVIGRPGLLALYPTLLALALAATALGIGVTLSLVRLLGVRRARTAAQLLGGLVGAAFFLLSQSPNMVGHRNMAPIADWVMKGLGRGGWLAADSALWLPGRAALGEPGPLAALLLLGVGSFWAVTRLAERRFLSGTQESVTGSAPRRGGSALPVPARMRAGLWRNVLVKEWRLILRDPQLISQTLLQTLYLVPLMLVGPRHQSSLGASVPAAVLLSTSLAGSLSWITVAAEDAPELIGTAPVNAARLRWAKLAAALLPVWLLVSPLMAALLVQDLWLAFVFALCVGAGTVATGALQIAYPRHGDRRDMKKRMQGSVMLALLEAVTTIGWAGTAYCLVSAWDWTPLPLLFAVLGPTVTWVLGRDQRDAAP